jgi:hypothetical protein
MKVPIKPFTITKIEGAIRQIEAAIDALTHGDFDVAITLAGAAEGMLERQAEKDMFSFLRDGLPDNWQIAKKDWIGVLNADRDWLKHPTPENAGPLTLGPVFAAFMIERAISKLEQQTPRMAEFRTWLRGNVGKFRQLSSSASSQTDKEGLP